MSKQTVQGVELTVDEYIEYQKLSADVDYCESLSLCYKILQNSYYGAQLNQNFKFYAKVAGESTTGTGRLILEHQIRKGCEILDGNYNISPIVSDEDPRAIRGEIASPSLIYGDTDSSIFTLNNFLSGTETLADKVKIADTIASVVNKSFPAFVQQQFLVQPQFSDKIKTGREIVASAAFFVSKKRYAMHVVDKEGIPKDNLKLMGLDARKTTTPRPVKAFLNKVVTNLLKGQPDDELDDFIMEYRDEMIDEIDLMDLGLPKGIKGIEQYTATFRDFPSTRLPGHVSAAILYNDFRQAAGDTESLLISSGMKIKIFKLKYEMEHAGRMFKAIAIPTDEELIPQWFKDEFFDKIDRQRHVGMLVDNMLHNMFDSIPRQVPTRQSKAYESEFSF